VKDFFNLNKRQERGIFVLSLIIMIMIIANHFAPEFASGLPAHITESSELLQQVKWQHIEKESIDPKVCFEIRKKESQKFKKSPVHLKIFNPNNISFDEMIDMGFGKFLASNIVKYRDKGGRFKAGKDLARIYGMEEAFYKRLLPYIYIPSNEKSYLNSSVKDQLSRIQPATLVDDDLSKPRKKVFLGINTADSVQLLQVKGIGPYYAGAIIRYRNRLGGFVDKKQLLELYNVDSTKYNMWKDQLFLDTVKIRKIHINTADFRTILKHPYLDYEATKYIVNKRGHLGQFAALYELKDQEKFPDVLYNKLLPYLSLD